MFGVFCGQKNRIVAQARASGALTPVIGYIGTAYRVSVDAISLHTKGIGNATRYL